MIRILLLGVALLLSSCTKDAELKRMQPGSYTLADNSDGVEEITTQQSMAHLHILAEKNGITIDGLQQSTNRGPYKSFDEVLPLIQKEQKRDFMTFTFGQSYWDTTPSVDAATKFFASEGWQRVLFVAVRGWGMVVLRDYHAGDPIAQ